MNLSYTSIPTEHAELGCARTNKVLIYIANTPNKTYFEQVVSWLRAANDPELANTLLRIENDLTNFPKAVDAEVKALKELTTQESAPAHLVVVTTDSLVAGFMEVQHAGTTAVINIPLRTDEVDQVQPLISPLALDYIFDGVAAVFSPIDHEFILISKSHGNENLALTSLMAGKLDITDSKKLTRALREARIKYEDPRHEH